MYSILFNTIKKQKNFCKIKLWMWTLSPLWEKNLIEKWCYQPKGYFWFTNCVCVCVCACAQSHPTLLRSHGPESTKFLCPWGLPGKSTGAGRHFLLQEIFPTQGLNLSLCVSYITLMPLGKLHQCYSKLLSSPSVTFISLSGQF